MRERHDNKDSELYAERVNLLYEQGYIRNADAATFTCRGHCLSDTFIAEAPDAVFLSELKAADIKPSTAPRTIIDPDDQVQGSIQIPVDKSRYRIRYINETEHYVDVVVEPKPKQ